MFKSEFVKFCVFKLGIIFILLSVFAYLIHEHKVNQDQWWMNILIYATTGVIPFLLFSGHTGLLLYGLYSWFRAWWNFVLRSKTKFIVRALIALYLICAPLIAFFIVSIFFRFILTNPLAGYQP